MDGAALTRTPTLRQYERLRILGSGGMVLAPRRREWQPLLRHGWVAAAHDDDATSRLLPPLRITPAGLIALAAAVQRHGHPDIDTPHPGEPAFLAKLRTDLDEARTARDRARVEARLATAKLERIRREVAA